MSEQQSFGVQCIPVEGCVFEDTIDGYFPLTDSVRQFLDRHAFTTALISLSHAPFIHFNDLDRDAAVPLKLSAEARVGQIREMLLLATLHDDHLSLCGVGDWSWINGSVSDDSVFSPFYRLAEPAFVHGVGLVAGDVNTSQFGYVKAACSSADVNALADYVECKLISLNSCSEPDAADNIINKLSILWGVEHREHTIVKRTLTNGCADNACLAEVASGIELLQRLKPGYEYLLTAKLLIRR